MSYSTLNSLLGYSLIVSFVLLGAPKDQWVSTFAIMAFIIEVRRNILDELRKNDE